MESSETLSTQYKTRYLRYTEVADSLTEYVNLPSIKATSHLLARVFINTTWQLAHIYILQSFYPRQYFIKLHFTMTVRRWTH